MNIAFPVGVVLAFAFMVFGIAFDGSKFVFGNLMNFVDITSVLVTVGGTLATLFATFPVKQFLCVPKHFPIILGMKKSDPLFYIQTMTDLSQEARKKGLLALEDSVAQIDDAFLRGSVMLIVDAMEPDKVRERLDNELGSIEERHSQTWDFYDKGAALAPGFGMIGTLIGLVNMLKAMDFEAEGGATALAQNMAVALITTFYGSVLANVIFIPMATQLRVAHAQEMICKEIVVEGVISIQAGENPRNVNEKLMTFLDAKQRDKAQEQSEAAKEE